MLFRRIVFSALLVGALSGLLLSAVQRWQVVPIIDTAERYEQARVPQADESTIAAGHAHPGASDHPHAGHGHADGAWEPAEGAERIAFTLLSNVLTAAGFALGMLATMAVLLRHNVASRRKPAMKLDWRYGLLWGLAGYAAFFVAPSLGLPPAIPGAETAPLEARQFWWAFTAVFTAVGIAVVAFGLSPWRWAGLALLVIPHLVGAPQHGTGPFAGFPADVAAELTQLAQRFVWVTAFANGVFWIALGSLSGWAAQRFVRKAVV